MIDYGVIGSIVTVVVFVAFVAVVFWTFNKKNKAGFEEAANLVFDDEPGQTKKKQKQESSVNE